MTQKNSAWAGASFVIPHASGQAALRKLFALLILISLSLTCSGCGRMLSQWAQNGHKLGPNHTPPPVKVANDWQQFSSPFRIEKQHAVVQGEWWNAFGDPEINSIVGATSRNNLSIAAAVSRIEQASWQQKIAVGNLLPQQQEFFAEFQRNQNSDNGDPLGIGGLGNTFDFYQFGFNASWEIDLWGRLKRQIEAAEANKDATIEDERDIRLSITAQAITAYLRIRGFQEQIANTRRNIEAQQKTVDLAKARLKDGVSSKLDLTQAESTLAVTKAAIAPLERGLKQANNQLCLLLGTPPKNLEHVMGISSIPVVPDHVVAGIPADLIRRRPDIRAAERRVASQSAQIGVAQAELFPTFSLRGTINWQAFKFADLFQSDSNAGSIIPGIRWNILNYGRLLSNVHFQEAKLQEAIINYQQTILKANTEVEDALAAFIKEKQASRQLQKAISSTEEAIKIANEQFIEGDTDFDRVNNLRKQLTEQRNSFTAAKLASAIALVNFYKAIGGDWHYDCSTVCFDSSSCLPKLRKRHRGRHPFAQSIPSTSPTNFAASQLDRPQQMQPTRLTSHNPQQGDFISINYTQTPQIQRPGEERSFVKQTNFETTPSDSPVPSRFSNPPNHYKPVPKDQLNDRQPPRGRQPENYRRQVNRSDSRQIPRQGHRNEVAQTQRQPNIAPPKPGSQRPIASFTPIRPRPNSQRRHQRVPNRPKKVRPAAPRRVLPPEASLQQAFGQ